VLVSDDLVICEGESGNACVVVVNSPSGSGKLCNFEETSGVKQERLGEVLASFSGVLVGGEELWWNQHSLDRPGRYVDHLGGM
jgi:hypothetical protein